MLIDEKFVGTAAINFLSDLGEKGIQSITTLLHREYLSPESAIYKAAYILDDYLCDVRMLDETTRDILSECLYKGAKGESALIKIWRDEVFPRLIASGVRLSTLLDTKNEAQSVMNFIVEAYMLDSEILPIELEEDMRDYAKKTGFKVIDNDTDAIFMARMAWLEQGTVYASQYLGAAFMYFQDEQKMVEKSFPNSEVLFTGFGAFITEECSRLKMHMHSFNDLNDFDR